MLEINIITNLSLRNTFLLGFLLFCFYYDSHAQNPQIQHLNGINIRDLPIGVKIKKYEKLPPPYHKLKGPFTVSIVEGEAFLEGDMRLGKEDFLDRFQNMDFSIVADPGITHTVWPKGIVRFKIDPTFDHDDRNAILRAMEEIAQRSNVCFVPKVGNQDHYINFLNRPTNLAADIFQIEMGGSSQVGMCRLCRGQDIAIYNISSVQHEILHALGLFHEQSREDRDQFVEILWDNIEFPQGHNFEKHVGDATDIGPYNFMSIMHYSQNAFGKLDSNGNRMQTIRRLDGGTQMRGAVLTAGDIRGINSLYPKNVKCKTLFPEVEATIIEIYNYARKLSTENQNQNIFRVNTPSKLSAKVSGHGQTLPVRWEIKEPNGIFKPLNVIDNEVIWTPQFTGRHIIRASVGMLAVDGFSESESVPISVLAAGQEGEPESLIPLYEVVTQVPKFRAAKLNVSTSSPYNNERRLNLCVMNATTGVHYARALSRSGSSVSFTVEKETLIRVVVSALGDWGAPLIGEQRHIQMGNGTVPQSISISLRDGSGGPVCAGVQ